MAGLQEFWFQQGIMGGVIVLLVLAVWKLFDRLMKSFDSRIQLAQDTVKVIGEMRALMDVQTNAMNNQTRAIEEMGGLVKLLLALVKPAGGGPDLGLR